MSAVLDSPMPEALEIEHHTSHGSSVALADAEPTRRPGFAETVMSAFARPVKRLPGRWLYDKRGVALYDALTRSREQLLARTESWILDRAANQIAAAVGRGATVIELGGAGSSGAARLFEALDAPAAHLSLTPCEPMQFDGALAMIPPWAERAGSGRRLVLAGGGAICRVDPAQAVAALEAIGAAVGLGSLLVVGVDSTLDPALACSAWDDRRGAAAAFNKNLIDRLNRELGADWAPSAFAHQARWNAEAQRVELHLVSQYSQVLTLQGRRIALAMGESIHTHDAYSYSVLRFRALARRAGWVLRQLWTDAHARCAVHVLVYAN